MQIDESIQAFAGVLSIGIALRHALFGKSYQDIDSGLNRMPDVVKRERQRDVTRERLSCWSSRNWLSWEFISQNCVEDSEQLSSDGDGSEELLLSGGDKFIAVGFMYGITTRGNQSFFRAIALTVASAARARQEPQNMRSKIAVTRQSACG